MQVLKFTAVLVACRHVLTNAKSLRRSARNPCICHSKCTETQNAKIMSGEKTSETNDGSIDLYCRRACGGSCIIERQLASSYGNDDKTCCLQWVFQCQTGMGSTGSAGGTESTGSTGSAGGTGGTGNDNNERKHTRWLEANHGVDGIEDGSCDYVCIETCPQSVPMPKLSSSVDDLHKKPKGPKKSSVRFVPGQLKWDNTKDSSKELKTYYVKGQNGSKNGLNAGNVMESTAKSARVGLPNNNQNDEVSDGAESITSTPCTCTTSCEDASDGENKSCSEVCTGDCYNDNTDNSSATNEMCCLHWTLKCDPLDKSKINLVDNKDEVPNSDNCQYNCDKICPRN